MKFNKNVNNELTMGQFDYETENYVYEYNVYDLGDQIEFCLDRYIHDEATSNQLIRYDDEITFNKLDFNQYELNEMLQKGKELLDQRCELYDNSFKK